MMIQRFLPVLLILGLYAGCMSTPNGGRDYGPAIKTTVGIGTSIAVREHPEWRPKFEMAAAELYLIEQLEKIDFLVVLSIVEKLPVKELRSDEARIVFSATTIWLSVYGGPEVDVTKAKVIVTALREGIEIGLGPTREGTILQSKAGYTAK